MSAAQQSTGLPLAVSLGDPAGIGPEIIVRAWSQREDLALRQFFICGGSSVLRDAADILELDAPVQIVESPSEAAGVFGDALPVLGTADADVTFGAPDVAGAALALQSLAEATRCALLNLSAAVVTAPVAKSELAKVGFEHAGQTEFLAEVCGLAPEDAVMMMAGPSLRTVPLTIHVALSEVSQQLTTELIVHRTQIVAKGLARDFGLARPRLAISGLNPHAGEDGKFGHEEAEIIQPAIERLQSQGLDVTGPIPADALFTPRVRQGFDVALCMYHDQALIPIKALEVDEGVNVTLGLPIIRTSPDHGTAFDIAGKGVADPGAMIAAIRMADQCAQAREANKG